MSLVKSPRMTEKNLAAHPLNGRKSRGPATPGGKARSVLMAPKDPNAPLMRRMQDSNFRDVWRITNLLLKIKRHERQMEGLEETAPFQDVSETKGVSNEGPKS